MNQRISRTRQKLMNALIDLMAEQAYASITIRDIVGQAGINRSTFYLHFYDKEDLLHQIAGNTLENLRESIRNPTFKYEEALQDYLEKGLPISSAVTLFGHIQEYYKFYRVMLQEKDFHDQLNDVIKDELLTFSSNELQASFSSGGIMGLIVYWLAGDMKESMEEMGIWLTQAVLYPLGRKLT